MQVCDYGDGPEVAGPAEVLFCAWLAWSCFGVVLPFWGENDAVGGDGAGSGAAADPQSKGGSEATVRIAKADVVPTDRNVRSEYEDFARLEHACLESCDRVDARRAPDHPRGAGGDVARERQRLHKPPQLPHTIRFGQAPSGVLAVDVSVGRAIYSAPSTLVDERVGARADGSKLVVVHADGPEGPREVARHALTTPRRRASWTSTTGRGRRRRWSASRAPARRTSGRCWRSAPARTSG
jgi:hypothetical protein